MAHTIVRHGGSYGSYGAVPAGAYDTLAWRAYQMLAGDISRQGYAQDWNSMPESYKTILTTMPLDNPGYFLAAPIRSGMIFNVPVEVRELVGAAEARWAGYGGYGAVGLAAAATAAGAGTTFALGASARNLQRLNAQLKKLKATRARVKTAARKKILDKRIKRLASKIKRLSERSARIAKRRRGKGKSVSEYRKRSLAAAKGIREERRRERGTSTAMRAKDERLKEQFPWAFRSDPPKWFLRGKSQVRRKAAWRQLSPRQRVERFMKQKRRKDARPGGPPPYRRPPQASPYDPSPMASEQEYEIDESIYESGTPTADMMQPWAQEEAMAEAELDSGVDLEGELDELAIQQDKRKLMPLWIGLGAVAIGGIIFAATRKRKKKTKPRAPARPTL